MKIFEFKFVGLIAIALTALISISVKEDPAVNVDIEIADEHREVVVDPTPIIQEVIVEPEKPVEQPAEEVDPKAEMLTANINSWIDELSISEVSEDQLIGQFEISVASGYDHFRFLRIGDKGSLAAYSLGGYDNGRYMGDLVDSHCLRYYLHFKASKVEGLDDYESTLKQVKPYTNLVDLIDRDYKKFGIPESFKIEGMRIRIGSETRSLLMTGKAPDKPAEKVEEKVQDNSEMAMKKEELNIFAESWFEDFECKTVHVKDVTNKEDIDKMKSWEHLKLVETDGKNYVIGINFAAGDKGGFLSNAANLVCKQQWMLMSWLGFQRAFYKGRFPKTDLMESNEYYKKVGESLNEELKKVGNYSYSYEQLNISDGTLKKLRSLNK